jgi:hypothetical protein
MWPGSCVPWRALAGLNDSYRARPRGGPSARDGVRQGASSSAGARRDAERVKTDHQWPRQGDGPRARYRRQRRRARCHRPAVENACREEVDEWRCRSRRLGGQSAICARTPAGSPHEATGGSAFHPNPPCTARSQSPTCVVSPRLRYPDQPLIGSACGWVEGLRRLRLRQAGSSPNPSCASGRPPLRCSLRLSAHAPFVDQPIQASPSDNSSSLAMRFISVAPLPQLMRFTRWNLFFQRHAAPHPDYATHKLLLFRLQASPAASAEPEFFAMAGSRSIPVGVSSC